MKPEALHSLSVVLLVAGLFIAALGMTGTFFFGKEADRTEGREQLAVLQGLTERVAVIQSDQAGLHARIASLDQRLATAPITPAPAPPEKPAVAVSAPPPATPSTVPPPRISLAAKLPPIGEGPRSSTAKPSPLKPATPAPAPAEKMAKLDVPPPKLPTVPPKTEPPKVRPSTELSRPAGERRRTGPPMTELQHARLIKRLRAYPQHSIVIRAEAGDTASVELGMALRAAFRDAGWEVAAVQLDSKRAPFPGLSLSTGTFPPPKEFVAAFGALEGAGFRIASNLDPSQARGRVVLSVGAKR